jgi:streptogramin lyase
MLLLVTIVVVTVAGCGPKPTEAPAPPTEAPTEVVEPTKAPTPTEPPEPTAPELMLEFSSPGPSPEDLAWDGSHLWVVDSETHLLYQVDPATGESVRELEIRAEQPQGVTWDGQNLWVLDQEVGIILRLEPDTGEETGSIEAPRLEVEGPWSTTGLTWDGRFLWAAIGAAWCSSFNRIDPDSGQVVESFFPQCDPRGLASDGTYLWTIAYNGEKLPSKLDRRQLSEDPGQMAQSQELLFDLDSKVKDPAGLAYGDEVLWAVDRAARRIFQVKVE